MVSFTSSMHVVSGVRALIALGEVTIQKVMNLALATLASDRLFHHLQLSYLL